MPRRTPRGLLGAGALFMSQNIIIMAKQRDPFARVTKSMLADSKISWRAKGILSYLLGKPSGWKLKISDVRKHGTEGERAVRSALKELRGHGYAELSAVRDGCRIVEWVWKVSDSPIFKKLDGRNAHLGATELDGRNEHVENEQVHFGHISKKEVSKAVALPLAPRGPAGRPSSAEERRLKMREPVHSDGAESRRAGARRASRSAPIHKTPSAREQPA